MKRICVIDYGMGNLRSVSKAFEKSGARVVISDDKKKILAADAVALPGVGSFDAAVRTLKSKGIWKILPDVIRSKPFFGICLGLQLLFERSEEGKSRGLGVLKGTVKRFPRAAGLCVPHMGWNTVRPSAGCPRPAAMKGIAPGEYFYFVHSYRASLPSSSSSDSSRGCGAGTVEGVSYLVTDYGGDFCSAVSFGRAFACQFHPEKSGSAGLKVIKNFLGALP
ncbi:MAG: imidazole glycerol phosphate synthase subunit HisH [Endomicrobiia bacterium]|nr:imidazole glycerol phosphate synthase subunit HisH [Endomicrobiia bacterium]